MEYVGDSRRERERELVANRRGERRVGGADNVNSLKRFIGRFEFSTVALNPLMDRIGSRLAFYAHTFCPRFEFLTLPFVTTS